MDSIACDPVRPQRDADPGLPADQIALSPSPDSNDHTAPLAFAPDAETRSSRGKGRKDVRDYKYSDIKPIMLKNRERGQKTKGTAIHKYLQRKYNDPFEGQLRTIQRMVQKLNRELDEEHEKRIKHPDEPFPEIFFRRDHPPGAEAQIDCTSLAKLGITIEGQPFRGEVFTFKLMYSKWIYACIVPGERTDAVLAAIQEALWALQGVPQRLRSDNGKALFRKKRTPTEVFNELCHHYGTPSSTINPGHPNENGGAETGNKTVKGLLQDRLTTDTDPDFKSEHALVALLREILEEHNDGKVQLDLNEERGHLGRLPAERLEPYVKMRRTVNKEGLLQHDSRYYSAPPELHRKKVDIRLYTKHLVIYNEDGQPTWQWPLVSDTKGRVDYRHVIHWLCKKPGAFNDYFYKDQLFPTEHFRTAYQQLEQWYAPEHAVKNYLAILDMATGPHPIRQDDDHLIKEVNCALELLLAGGKRFTDVDVQDLVEVKTKPKSHRRCSTSSQLRFS